MDDIKRQKLAAGIVIGVAAMACVCITAILAGSYIYLGLAPAQNQTPAVVSQVTPTPWVMPTYIVTPSSAPIQSSNPFHIESMKCDGAKRTYTFTLSLAPGAHPAEISKIVVNATHAGKDYGTVWTPFTGQIAWDKKSYDNGALHYGDLLVITIDVAAKGIPMDGKSTQITFLYDGRAAFTQNMEPV
ncbi:hypothetical protein [Methanocella sp. MCL-LM]|uniref:hypothetical protein n=1 Tax=Methanocella sp. MCL-LM TaxID=3412035 RepID=UPI003C75E3C2